MAGGGDALRNLVLELEEERVRCARAGDGAGLRLLAERVAAELPAGGARTWLLGEIARNCEHPWGAEWGTKQRVPSLPERVRPVEWAIALASAVAWIAVVAVVASRLMPYAKEDRHLPLEEGIRLVVVLAVAAFLTGLLAPRRARWWEVAIAAAAACLVLGFGYVALSDAWQEARGEPEENPIQLGVGVLIHGLPTFVLIMAGRAARVAGSCAVRRRRGTPRP